MKQISCHLNETQYAKWQKKRGQMTDYEANKTLVLGFINGEAPRITILKMKVKEAIKEAILILDQCP